MNRGWFNFRFVTRIGFGNLILESWNCLTCGLLQSFAGVSFTSMIWIVSALARCLAPMSLSKSGWQWLVYNQYNFFQILTARCHCSRYTHIPIFPVHVVGTSSRIISQPDAIVLDAFVRLNSGYLSDLYDLTRSLFHFLLSPKKIPETWFSHYMIWCIDGHPI